MRTNSQSWIPLLVLVVCVLGCSLFRGSDAEMVFAPTEIGTPEGEKVTKPIGPEGGSLSSLDGRMTLTVPPNTLTETLTFSIQPISNKAGNGLGLAYRLEPEGSTFATPLDVTIRYDEQDLEGTIAEALALAYQDKQGAWHAQKRFRLDEAAKTATISTTHFTDFAVLSRMRLEPTQATVKVKERQGIGLLQCKDQSFLDRIRSKPAECSAATPADAKWEVRGPGTIKPFPSMKELATYTAPASKPDPNIAFVRMTAEFERWDPENGQMEKVTRTFQTKITIVDAGYRVTGKVGDVKFSGKVCDFNKPFKVRGVSSFMSYNMFLSPTSESGGVITFDDGAPMLKASGTGRYTVEQPTSGNGKLIITMNSIGVTPHGSRSGGGTMELQLVPLEPNEECKINEEGLQIE